MSNIIKLLDVFSEAKIDNPDNHCQLQRDEFATIRCTHISCRRCIFWFNSFEISDNTQVNLGIAPILKELVNDYKLEESINGTSKILPDSRSKS